MTSALDESFARLRDRGITRLSYFHCDHFEPWRWGDGLNGLDETNAVAVEEFVAAMERLPYARRLTLFMKSPIRATSAARRRTTAIEGDEIGFSHVKRRERNLLRRAMGAITGSAHELQVHIHHERFTRNEHYSTSPDRPGNAEFREFLTHRSTPEMDEERLRLYLELTLGLFRRTSGLPLERWFFVHGMWSLNGSDRDFCCVDGELDILRRLGCLGDFTFPAPREHCNPSQPAPYLVEPHRLPKAYDRPEGRPSPALGQPLGANVFIWSTNVSARYCSLDTVSKSFAALAEDPGGWAVRLLDGAVERDGAVYVKTHAHSMMVEYFAGPEPVYPHSHPAVQALFGALMEGAARAEIAFDPITASEAYDRFVAPELPGA